MTTPTTARPSGSPRVKARPHAGAVAGTGLPEPRHPRLRHVARRWRHRGLTAEAMVLLTVSGALQKWVPMTTWSPLLGTHGPVPQEWHGSTVVRLPARAATAKERRVAVAIRSGAAHLPWHATCLAEATTGQVLLRQLRQPGVVVIGLRVT